MSDPHIRAAFYLSPTLDEWWRWSDDAQVLAWPDERTIAFQPEVEAVLGRLAAGGLPPFGAVALLLAACRDGWADSPGRATIAGYATAFGGMGVAAGGGGGGVPAKGLQLVFGRVAQQVARLVDGLDAVNRLPPNLRNPTTAKAVLAETVFEAAKNRGTPDDAALVVRAMEAGLSAESLRPQLSNEEALAQFAKQVDGLAEGLARVDAAKLARRLATGLDEEVRPADADDVAPPERVRRLLAELRTDADLAGLARLAQDLMAAVAVPRALRVREELAIGGVSDLTNRGPLDRLIVSELAHDDLTLAVRVAVNEALYVRRESPPREPPHRRAILLDAGVRTWGVPRVFATAVALALSATNDPAADLRVFRATAGGGAEPVDLTTRAGLAAHLAALETTAHPGASLRAFLDASRNGGPRRASRDRQGAGPGAAGSERYPLQQRPAAAGRPLPDGRGSQEASSPVDAFVVTHADAAADPEFVAFVRALCAPLLYVAGVDRDGAFRLAARTLAGEKPVREARLSLDKLLAKPKLPEAKRPPQLGVPLVASEGRRDDLPAIFFADPFPLLLPQVAGPKRAAASAAHGLIAATDDGRLLHWRDRLHGARQLTSKLPRGLARLVLIDDADRAARVVITRGKDATAHLVQADLATGACTLVTIALRRPAPQEVFAWAGAAYLLYAGHLDAYALADGRHLGSMELPDAARWHRGRYFRFEGKFFAAAYDGTPKLKLERVPVEPSAADLFDRAGHDGPWAVTGDGRLLDSAGQVRRKVMPTLVGGTLLGTSADGERIAFKDRDVPARFYVVDLGPDNRLERVQGDWHEALLVPQIFWSTRNPVSLRKRFQGVGVDGLGRVAVQVGPAAALPIDVDAEGRLALGPVARGEPLLAYQPFYEVRRPDVARLKMHAAAWPDGSRAWLDGRGLLHLKSADPELAEVTIALRHDPGEGASGGSSLTAAWSSDGKVCGPAFFIGGAAATAGGHFTDIVHRFRMRLR